MDNNNREDLIGGYVCGIVGLILGIISFFVCWWLSIIALVLGVITLVCFHKGAYESGSLLILGGIDIVVSLIALTITIIVFCR